MGDVFLGVAQGPAGFSKLMVIKMLRPALADDEQFLQMFLDEARLAARLSHPNIVQTTEVGNEDRKFFLAMEYLEGQSLQRMRTRIAKDQPFPLGPHLRILVEACNGLHYAHELVDIDGRPLNIVHRDATPHNIFVTYDGQVKVVDFGIAKAMDSSLETRTGELKGKIAYMPPEQASAQRVDRRADVFAMGVMLWEAVVGRRLWKGLNEIAIMHQLVSGNIPGPRDIDPSIPEELDAICRRALSTRPEGRHPTAADLANDLEQYLLASGDRTTTRDIARLLSAAFEADRRELREIIDGQLRLLREGPNQGVPITITVPKLPGGTGSTSGSAAGSASVMSIARPTAAQLDHNIAPSFTPSFTTGGTASSAGMQAPQRPRSSITAAVLMIIAAVALLGLVVVVVLKQNNTKAGPTPVDPAGHPTGDTIDVTVNADPPSAQLFLDDAPLGPPPYHQTFPRDGVAHRIRAESVLYAPRTEVVVFDKPAASLTITLQKGVVPFVGTPGVPSTPKPPPPIVANNPHPHPTATAEPSATATGHGGRPPRTIDTSFGP